MKKLPNLINSNSVEKFQIESDDMRNYNKKKKWGGQFWKLSYKIFFTDFDLYLFFWNGILTFENYFMPKPSL